MDEDPHTKNMPQRAEWLAGGSLIAGASALIGASCCVLPIVLLNLGIGGALVSNLQHFARAKGWVLGVSVLLIIGGVIPGRQTRSDEAVHLRVAAAGYYHGSRRLHSALLRK